MASSTRSKSTPPRVAGYSGTPLPAKLGIKPGMRVGLIHAPADFERTLGKLGEGATLCRNPRRACDLVLWFTTSRPHLRAGMKRACELAGRGGMWIIWPKKAGRISSDLSEDEVRRAGLACGWVDYKVCAVDEDWSGLKFARRVSTASNKSKKSK